MGVPAKFSFRMRYRLVRTLPQKWHHYSVKTRRKEISDENIHYSKKPTKNSSYQHLQAILAVILVIVLCDYASTSTVIGVAGFVIAPPWANPQLNPCSATSWQLIHWPGDGVCYPIFSQVCHYLPRLLINRKIISIFNEWYATHQVYMMVACC